MNAQTPVVRPTHRFHLATGLALLWIAFAMPALAQEAPDDEKPAPPAAAPEESPAGGESYLQPDIRPSVELFRDGDRSLEMGAFLQIYAIPFVEEEALVANGDAANEEGFRLRRTRLAFRGGLHKDVSLNLSLNPVNSDDFVYNANLQWAPLREFGLTVGSAKVPYSRSMLDSSSRLRFVDRPMSTGELAFGNRLGASVEGQFLDGAIGYVGGAYNATENYRIGNESDGLVVGGRLESQPMGPIAELTPDAFRLRAGAGALFEDGPTVDTTSMSADVLVEMWWVRLRGEYLSDHREPESEPLLPPTQGGEWDRFATLGEATAFIVKDQIELAFRYERYDIDQESELVPWGRQQLFTGGLNWYIDGHRLKAQVNYIHRDERQGPEIANDAAILSFVGAL